MDNVEHLFSYKKIPGYLWTTLKSIATNDLCATSELGRNARLLQGVVMRMLLIIMAFAMRQYAVSLKRNLVEPQQAAEAERFAKEQVTDRAAQLQIILSLNPDAFVSFDTRRRFKYVTPSFARITGLNQSNVHRFDEDAFSNRLAVVCLASKPFRGVKTLRQEAEFFSHKRPTS